MRAAFTLIELMVVLALIGVMTAMIIPEMKGTYEDALLRSGGRDLVNVFNLAYSRAVSVNQLHRVRLDRRTGRYFVEKAGPDGGFAALGDVPGGQGAIDSRIAIEIRTPEEDPADESDGGAARAAGDGSKSESDAIGFYPDGTADAREILLRDRAGFRLRLRINPVTARVHITEANRE